MAESEISNHYYVLAPLQAKDTLLKEGERASDHVTADAELLLSQF